MREIKNLNEFKEVLEEGKPILLDFYADWCGPCQMQLPIVEKLAEQHKEDFVIAKVNVDTNGELAQQFAVRSIPSLFFIQNGEIVENLVGLQSETSLKAKIAQYTVAA